VATTLKPHFGSFIIAEIWTREQERFSDELSPQQPAFTIYRSDRTVLNATVAALENALKNISIRKLPAVVSTVRTPRIAPPGRAPLLSRAEARAIGCHVIGIEVRPIYVDAATDQLYPLVRQELRRAFSRALRSGFFRFTLDMTTHRPAHYLSLGRGSVVKAVWEVDRQLAEIYSGFDFILQVTPANASAAWATFKRKRFQATPEFLYRPLPLDPRIAKRELYKVPIERIEDVTLAQLFREQQLELDRKLTMLIDRDTPRFLFGSLQVFGVVDDSLLRLALLLLEKLSSRSRDESTQRSVDAEMFAERAREELEYFRLSCPECGSKVLIRDDITGLMVSQGNLLIGKNLKISPSRVEALIQHEVGTHVLTYLNGKKQPFRQLFVGLAGYEELQEGLAVLSEYLVGGLTRPRMRLLAARVVAAHRLIDGAGFIDVFRELNAVHGFERREAFTITMRIFRSGGLTKDAVYLRGLIQLLSYLKNGGALEPLFIGKISADHVAMIQELQLRNVLHPAPLRPRYLGNPQTTAKLARLRKGIEPLELLKRSSK
jgi:uncharacterized protein (TIGR02421 family)